MILLRRAIIACILAMSAVSPVAAQSYPSQTIKLIVPYAAGGLLDIVSRAIARQMSARLGAPVVVENRPGAASQLGIAAAINSPPDGYTLLFAAVDGTTFPSAHPFPYDPDKDLVPLGKVAFAETVLAGAPTLKANTIQEVIAEAKANPGKLTITNLGTGSTAHLAAELFQLETGTKLLNVPYRGSAAAYTDLLGGRVDLTVTAFSSVGQHVPSGVKPLVSLGAKRNPQWPNVPTLAELGYPKVVVETWMGVFAPAKVPDEVVSRISQELPIISQSREFTDAMAKITVTPTTQAPAEFAASMKREREFWAEVVKKANIDLGN